MFQFRRPSRRSISRAVRRLADRVPGAAGTTRSAVGAALLAGAIAAAGIGTSGATLAAEQAGSGATPRVIELFTSHGCSSCPPADALLGELIAADPDLIALEFHVDYWNRLVHGRDGNWVDPFSDPLWTQRQRDYDMAPLEGRRGVYTPQAIVNGRFASVGSDAKRIRAALEREPLTDVTVDVRPAADGLQAVVGPGDADADVWLVRYLDTATTEIGGGENRDRTLVNHRIVRSMERLGSVGDETLRFDIDPPGDDAGCAVLVQRRAFDGLAGAAACP